MPASLILEVNVQDLLRHSDRRQGVRLRRGWLTSQSRQFQRPITNGHDGFQNPLIEDGQDATRRRRWQSQNETLDEGSVSGASIERVWTPLRPGHFPCVPEGIVDSVGTANGGFGGLPQLQVDMQCTD
jgi:hypothetical protein